MREGEHSSAAFDQQPGAIADMLKQAVGALRVAEHDGENLLHTLRFILGSIIGLHRQREFTTYAQLLFQCEFGTNPASLIPVVQQPFDAELVK